VRAQLVLALEWSGHRPEVIGDRLISPRKITENAT
jgi:hypothetical protein